MGLHGASAGSFPRRSLARFRRSPQDSLSGLKVIDLEVKSRGASGCLGTRRLQHRSGWRLSCDHEPVRGPLELVPLQVLTPRCDRRSVAMSCLVTWTLQSP
jgi:hypothetical protein